MHKTTTLLAIFLGSALLLSAKEAIKPSNKAVYKTVDSSELKLHIFNPEGHQSSDRRPAIIFFFGGGWNGGTPKQHYPHCQHLAKLGIVAMAAEYRTKSSHGTSPMVCLKDGKSALRWVLSNASTLGINSSKLIAGGGSAGVHIASAVANCHKINDAQDDLLISTNVRALVLFNPVFDNSPEGYGHNRVKAYWRDFSPMHNLSTPHSPPTIIFSGTEDHLIPVATAEKYQSLMEQLKVPCELHLYQGQKHGFFNANNPEYFSKTVSSMDIFLEGLGLLEAQKTQ